MSIAVFNRNTNQVRTVIRDDHNGYLPPEGWELLPVEKLPKSWIQEPLPKTDRVALIAEIKQGCEAKILAVLPAWKQRNMIARGLELARKEYRGEKMTPQEQSEYEAIETAWRWVKELRAQSDAEEALLQCPQ